MKLRRSGLAFLICFALALPLASAERVTVTILSTTDLHGYIYPYDYYTSRPANWGLAKVATIIKQIRAERPHALLVDCGDVIEGSPLEYVHAHRVLEQKPEQRAGAGNGTSAERWSGADRRSALVPLRRAGLPYPALAQVQGPVGEDPMMLAMNALDYDAMVVGNHEFNFGLPVLLKAKREARFEWLSANVTAVANEKEALALRRKDTEGAARSIEERVFTPMLFKEVDGVSVAIIGVTTPTIPSWERPENIRNYRFESPVEEAREWVQHARERRHADLVVVAAHMGLERDVETGRPGPDQLPGENQVYAIANSVPGIDGILFGHTHQELAGKSVHGVILAQARNWGRSVAEMTFTVERDSPDARWKVVEKSSRVIPVTDQVAADPEILELAEPYHEEAQKHLDTPVAEARGPLETRYGRVMPTAALDALHEVQRAEAKADVSLAAVFNVSLAIPRGPVTVRQIAALYPYENTLVAVEATGQMLKDALEHAARFYNTYDPAHPGPLVNPEVFGYNYDMAAGVRYQIDLTRPLGARIVDLRFHGRPLAPSQKLRLAINSYRRSGGGGYNMFRDAQVLWQSSQDIRRLMMDYYTAKKVIEAKVDHNWKIVPEAAEKLLIHEVEGPAQGAGKAKALALDGAGRQAEPHLANLRQLTFGGANAEAYFSPDGKRLIFQSTRDGRKCDQIYIMNVDGSGVRMVSTGRGRTTCGFFFPDGRHILYSSTHEASPECPPEPDRSKGYLWPVYDSYEIYEATDDGRILGKLAPHPGYDAEAVINWKTKRMVWTSTRDGDLNLWTMDLRGRRLRQATRRAGYDGGAVFSPDGKQLAWRAYYPPTPEAEKDYREKLAQGLTAPMKMEIFVSDAEGKNPRQITRFGCASFAPAFTPDGRKILFASNKNRCDSRYFELFLINADGTGLEQVTDSGGFTSFPMFSPDGKKLVFVSDRNAQARYEFNIFIAEWK